MKVKMFKIPSHFWLQAGTQKRNLVLLLLLLLIFELWQIEFFEFLNFKKKSILKACSQNLAKYSCG